MPRIADLRRHVSNHYLNNNVISGAEAKDLVGRAKLNGELTTTGKAQLESLRPEVWQRWWLEVRTELEDQIQAAADG